MPEWLTVLSSCVGSAAFIGFVQYMISRHDRKNEDKDGIKRHIAEIDKALDKAERDSIRIQMLLLMSDYPFERQELMTLAQRYFVTKKGDWYMTSLFNNYIKRNAIIPPPWFERVIQSEDKK